MDEAIACHSRMERAAGVPTLTRQRFAALDGLRGLAAVAVLLYHVRETTPVHWLAPHGYLAVDFFFALSGFVIAHAYSDALTSRTLSPGQFILRRFARLWPAAVLGTLLGIVPAIAGELPIDFGSIPTFVALGALLIPSIGTGGEFFPLNPPEWSLFDEIAANAVYSMGICRLRLRVLAGVTVIAGALTAVLLFRTGGTQFAGGQRVVYPYLAGTLAYGVRAAGIRNRRSALAWTLAALTIAGLWIPEATGRTEAIEFSALSLVVFPLTVWAVADVAILPQLQRAYDVAGSASYPLYAIHYPLLLIAWHVGANIPLTIAAIVALSIAVGQYYDLPLRRAILRRLFPRRVDDVPVIAPTPV